MAATHRFDISLAAWSMHKLFFARQVDQLGMLDMTQELGIGAIELVNTFFPSPQYAYLKQLRNRADDLGVTIPLIMCDGEGSMAAPDQASRLQAVKNHHKWIDIACVLGCHSIRCNTGARDGDRDALDRCADSFPLLLEYADAAGINVLIENHWGPSSDPDWLMALMDRLPHPRFGTLPDFGNFPATVDAYEAVQKMMRRAFAVSAKCYDFGADGDETKIDYPRMLDIVTAAGYRGYVGIEFEGERLSERDGIAACKALLERLR
jgi:L-ribulose-5-phosphate 3-epimerase